ncbi:cation diffusion facilitator family transporter [Burkholderia ubonensis]|uniref:cation diffusion facilitator family transporter n=1 Tax=Burkholderia ubonensis TaxID=101571 RepID=UPI0005DA0967|nr:cation diffusion facilitator family transporter [Burkholderia ubonensis]AJX15217.1 cation diffusion facilitator transporter family protein [Burkholderia ubonensis MSMB22]KVD12319.1 cation diffusion facilitator family transporter [Burkholderia ubonensis]KVD33736.1 cation diffusion facilitator family transporter [Burkholderia ubonensis]KVM08497.1 cation diffusion facilitator family transporter [Burkholderia ubonensis]KVM15425.1 cation diffusion facilitator family transporter [Burkholderia ubo
MSTFSGDAHGGEKHAVARKSTLVSIVLNVVLATFQIVVGTIAHSQALIADGIHSISDLISDFVVLVANRHSGAMPDADHNYGHSRYETVASLFLGGILIAVGIGMLWRAGDRLVHLEDIPPVHFSALIVAVTVLVSKEALFRYMLREAQRVRSAMLVANAWHARSDAASSLVVAIGIVGSLAGVRLLDPIAAAIVGFMVARMGWTFGYDALQDLSDRALDETDTAEIRALLAATPGVRDVHDLRTRKMGDSALVDAHILVDPMISVSEGHYIAETARARVLSDRRVLDALIHVDPENDAARRPALALPPRGEIAARLEAELARRGLRADTVNLHYLSTGLEIDVTLAADPHASADADAALAERLDVGALARQFGARRIGFTRAVPERP